LTVEPTLKALIRHASAEDIPAMVALQGEAGGASHWSRRQYEQILVPLLVDAEQRARERFQDCVLIAEEKESVQGFFVARGLGNEWEIENIVVAVRMRKLGLGTQLLNYFLKEVRQKGAQTVFLEVRESNRAAFALYEKFGFQPSGRRKAYYQQPTEDAISYQLDFR